MREIAKATWDWYMDMSKLRDITKEVYGIGFDVQMGEEGQGTSKTEKTGEIDSRQGYWTGLGQGHGYSDKYIEGSKYVYFDEVLGVESDGNFGPAEHAAIDKWTSQDIEDDWSRPFDEVGTNGEYVHYQPALDVVLTDLANREEIPHGVYYIDISW